MYESMVQRCEFRLQIATCHDLGLSRFEIEFRSVNNLSLASHRGGLSLLTCLKTATTETPRSTLHCYYRNKVTVSDCIQTLYTRDRNGQFRPTRGVTAALPH